MSIIRTIHNKDNPYFMLNRAAVNDERLSYKAIGIHTYLMSKPDNWTVRESDLAGRHTEGTTAVRSGLEELKKYGYVTVESIRDDKGKITQWETHVHEIPQCGEPECGKPTNWESEDIVSNDSLESNDSVVSNVLHSSPDGDGQRQEENPQPEEQQDAVTPTSIPTFKDAVSEIESAASAPSLWQQQVGALCWVCYEHDKVDLLTAEKKGQLTREASVIFKKHDFTLDDLRLWYRHIWKKRWPGTERRPYPSEVRSGIAAIRQREPSGNVWEEMKIAEDGGTPVSESSWELDPVMMGAYEILKAKGYS